MPNIPSQYGYIIDVDVCDYYMKRGKLKSLMTPFCDIPHQIIASQNVSSKIKIKDRNSAPRVCFKVMAVGYRLL